MLLAGDIGGTKTLLALFEERGEALAPVRQAEFPSRGFATLDAAIRQFLGGGPPVAVSVACFGVAGPVVDGRVTTTNLPWQLDEARLAHGIPAGRVKLLNDLDATAHGALVLPAAALVTLQAGVPRAGNAALIAAGTGLGEALLVRDGTRFIVSASEGGHADFAPRTDLEIELLRFLGKEFGHVSYERVLSGPGIHNVYRCLRARGSPEPAWLTARLEKEDPGAVITEVALAGGDPVCVQTLELIVSVYGAEAGNLALRALAVGGIFIAGGIGPKIATALGDGRFMQAFRDKGRFAGFMAAIPVHLVLEPRTALLGAAHVARCLYGGP
jgi:glucokinase